MDKSVHPPAMRILALHGFTGVGEDFAPFAELCGGTWHCPNLPGHGPDALLECSPEASIRCIESKRSTFNVQHAANNVLLGYSMGARAALLHAIRNPEVWDALILISPNPGIEDERERARRRDVDEKLARRIEAVGLDAFIRFWQKTPIIRSQQQIRADWRATMQRNRKLHTIEGLAASLRQFGQGHCPNLWPELEQLTMPTLLVTGDRDIKYRRIAERMRTKLSTGPSPSVQHFAINGVGHMPHLEDAETSANVIEDFLAEFL